VFLFDEPLSNLDAKLRVAMRTEIKEPHQRLKTTSIYVTHDQIEAMTMADKIVVLQAGRVEQIGTPLELYDKPNNIFVAGFLGSPAMNFLEGTVGSGPESTLKLASGTSIKLSRRPEKTTGDIVIGVRPEAISLAKSGGVAATVMIVEPTGSETHIALDLEGREITWVARERVGLTPGQKVDISFETPDVHFFDKETQQRL
jgi:multiple sugar transport system ATP-binding protein